MLTNTHLFRIPVVFIAMALIGLVGGCGEEPEQVAQPTVAKRISVEQPAAPKVSQAPASEKTPEPETPAAPVAARYNPIGRLDPFEPLIRSQPETVQREERAKEVVRRTPLTPLERVDLSQLNLKGVIASTSGNRALVEQADGKGYIVGVGTRIGIHSGRIVRIDLDRMIVEEEVEDLLGELTKRTRELKLQKPPGEE